MQASRKCTRIIILMNGHGLIIRFRNFYGLDPETITAQDIIGIVKAWQQAVVGLDKMVYEDAKKRILVYLP